jgi:hypothetical protein
VMRSLVDRLIKDESLGFEAKASEILMPLATSIDLEVQVDFLDALCYVQMKSVALFQLINESALTAIITASHRNTLMMNNNNNNSNNKKKSSNSKNNKEMMKKISQKNKEETAATVAAMTSSSSSSNAAASGTAPGTSTSSATAVNQQGESSEDIAKAAAARWGASTSTAVSSLFESFKQDYFERELYVLRNSIVDILLDAMCSNPDSLYISNQVSIVKFNSGNHSSDLDPTSPFSSKLRKKTSSSFGGGEEDEDDKDKDDFDEEEEEDKFNDNPMNSSPKKGGSDKRASRSIRPVSSNSRRIIPSSFSSFSTPTILTNLNSPSRFVTMNKTPRNNNVQSEDDVEGVCVCICCCGCCVLWTLAVFSIVGVVVLFSFF